jgi:UDP-N-acetylmuramoyl-L-alanyl-D-glutamate--2,6-diaminopimelate ligase
LKLIRVILYKAPFNSVIGNTSLTIYQIEFDSRLINEGDMYVAIKGINVDGHDFIPQAIQNGANCIICEKTPDQKVE